SGRPIPAGATRIRPISVRTPMRPSRASAAPEPRRAAPIRSRPSSRARSRAPMGRRLRILSSPYLPAACCAKTIRGSISPTRRTTAIPFSRSCRRNAVQPWSRNVATITDTRCIVSTSASRGRARRSSSTYRSTQDKRILGRNLMLRKGLVTASAAVALWFAAADRAGAQDGVKIGLILPMTGPQASTGRQIDAAVKLYQQQNGTSVAGKKVEVILKDDGSVPDNTKRIAQELIVNDKVAFIAGFGVTPAALTAAALATQAKVPEVVLAAGTSIITERSPYIVRTSFTLPQSSVIIADWAIKNGIKKVVSIVSDYAPGADSENSFKERFTAAGGQLLEAIRVPLQNPDFAPFLQRARDAQPDAIFVFVPSGQGGAFVKQFA